jgi:DNA-binding transcriptional MerR regulator
VIAQTGITHQVLYRYITLGLIEPVRTTPTGLRYFRPNVVALIGLIRSLTEDRRYSLRELKEIFFKDHRVQRLMAQATP